MVGSLNILLVEDEPNDALLVDLALQRMLPGVSLVVLPDGIKAVEYLKGLEPRHSSSAHPFPDVVLLDLRLPLMDGMDVLSWIRQQPDLRFLPVIALTGSPFDEDVRRACEAGANFCVLKSQGFRRLAELVMQLAPSEEPAASSEILPGPSRDISSLSNAVGK